MKSLHAETTTESLRNINNCQTKENMMYHDCIHLHSLQNDDYRQNYTYAKKKKKCTERYASRQTSKQLILFFCFAFIFIS